MQSLIKRNLAWIILIILAVIWGSSFILIKKGLEHFSSDKVGALRIIITFLFLLPPAFSRFKRVKKEHWFYLIVIGLIGSAAPAFLFAKAQTGIDSSLAGILNSLTPIFTLFIGMGFFHLKTKWYNIAGVFVAFVGAMGLINVSGNQSFEFNLSYAVYVVIATICYATNVNLIKVKLKDLDAFSITVYSFFVVGLPVIVYLYAFTDFHHELMTEEGAWQGIFYIAILAIVGTALALIAFNYVIKISTPVFAASVTYLIPIVAVFWGIIDGEAFDWYYVIWISLVIAGVFLVNKKASKKG